MYTKFMERYLLKVPRFSGDWVWETECVGVGLEQRAVSSQPGRKSRSQSPEGPLPLVNIQYGDLLLVNK